MKKIFIPLAILLATCAIAQTENTETKATISVVAAPASKIILSEGTVVYAALKNEIRGGKLKVGDEIEFTLSKPIIVGDQIIIQTGAKILGSVSEARASGVLGRKGKLSFDIEYLYLDNGQVIKLIGQNAKNLKGSGLVVAATSVILSPLGLLIPGKGAKFEAGTVFDSYIAKDTELR